MIWGRPVNLVLGAITATVNVVVVAVHTIPVPELQPLFNDALVATFNIAIGALIAVIANQTPTVNSGDPVHVVNPGAEPNTTVTV